MVHVQQHSETMYTTDIVNYINHSSIMVLFPPATTCNLKTLDNDLQLPEPSNQWWHKTWSLFIPEGLSSHFSKSESETHLAVSDSLWPHGLYRPHGILQARILEWVVVPFSRGSSQPRDWTQVSHIAGRFFTSRSTREIQEYCSG